MLIQVPVVVAQCGQSTWKLSCGGPSGDHGAAVLAHSYGDVYVLGYTENAGNNTDILLTKTNVSGTLIWSKAIHVGGDDAGIAIAEGTGGSIVIGGVIDGLFTLNADGVVMRLDTAGQVQWATRVLPISGYCQIRAITETVDGIFVSGSTNSIGQGQTDAFIARLSSSGSLLWLKSWGSGPNDHFTTIQALGDGSIIASSHYQYSSNDRRPNYLRVDINGNVITNMEYTGGTVESFSQLLRNPDGSFLGIGYSEGFGAGGRDVMLVHLDSLGNYNWSMVYGTLVDERGISGVPTFDGGWLINCKNDDTGDGRLMKVDSAGGLQWVHSVPDHSYGNWAEWGIGIAGSVDGSMVVMGNALSNDPNGDLLVFKVNACGDMPCGQDILTWAQAPANLIQQAVTKVTDSSNAFNPATTTTMELTSLFLQNMSFEVCSSTGVEDQSITQFQLFPNPSSGSIEIRSPKPLLGATVSINDVLGREVLRDGMTGIAHSLDMRHLPKGIYILTLRSDDGIWSTQVVLE